MKTQQAKQGVIRTRHIIGSITSFTWSWAKKKHFTNQGYILYGYMALYWYVHSIPFTNFLWTTKKQTFLRFLVSPREFSISPTWRYSPTCGEHGPTTASRSKKKTVRETIVFQPSIFQVICYFQLQNMTIKSHGIDSEPFFEKSCEFLSKKDMVKGGKGEDIGQEKSYCSQLNLRCFQPPQSLTAVWKPAKSPPYPWLMNSQYVWTWTKTNCAFSCLPTEGQT